MMGVNNRPPALNSRGVRAGIAAALLVALGVGFYALVGNDGGVPSGPVSVANAPTAVATPMPDSATGPLDEAAPIIGQPAPDFALRDADGTLVTLSDLRGNVVWVNFWATWCRPCKQELPDIQRIYDEKAAEGLIVLAINFEEPADRAIAYFRENGLTVPMLLDLEGDVYDQYRLQGLPDSFFIDRDGNIAAVQFGLVTEKKGRERLAAAGLP